MTAVLFALDVIGFSALAGAILTVWAWDLWLDYLDRRRIAVLEHEYRRQLEELETKWRILAKEPTR